MSGKRNSKPTHSLIAMFLCLCLGITTLAGCSRAASSDGTIYLESTSQTVDSSTENTETASTVETTSEPASEETSAEETTEVTATVAPVSVSLIAVGDMLLHGGIHNSALQADGSIGYVQPIGEKPDPTRTVDAHSQAPFGTGAWLLAACEYAKYCK